MMKKFKFVATIIFAVFIFSSVKVQADDWRHQFWHVVESNENGALLFLLDNEYHVNNYELITLKGMLLVYAPDLGLVQVMPIDEQEIIESINRNPTLTDEERSEQIANINSYHMQWENDEWSVFATLDVIRGFEIEFPNGNRYVVQRIGNTFQNEIITLPPNRPTPPEQGFDTSEIVSNSLTVFFSQMLRVVSILAPIIIIIVAVQISLGYGVRIWRSLVR